MSQSSSKLIYLLLVCLSFINLNCRAQLEDYIPCYGIEEGFIPLGITDCNSNSIDYVNIYRYQQSYIPEPTQAIKTIKISFHIWNDINGEGSFSNTLQSRVGFQMIIDWINGWHANVSIPSDPVPGAGTISDTRIRYELADEDIHFYENTALNQSSNISAHNNEVFVNYPDRRDALMIHFSSVGPGSGAGGHSNGTVEGDNSICGILTAPVIQTPPNGLYALAQHLFHELAHNLNLLHTYDGDNNGIYTGESCCPESCNVSNIDFLTDVFDVNAPNWCGTTCSVCYHSNICGNAFDSPTDFCTNNIMTGKGATAYCTSPLQAGEMHRSSCLYSIRQYMWGYDPNPHKIVQNETWDFSIKSYQDIVIKSGATLTVTCEIQMVPEAKIIVEPGGKLHVDGGKITIAKYAEGFWQGIEVHGISNLGQGSGQQGQVLLTDGAIIEHALCAITLWEPNNFSSTGGFVRSFDATFRNNITDVKAMFYANISGTHHLPNKTYFSNTEFIWDNNFRTSEPECHVVLALVDGINFKGCTFEDKRDPNTISFSNGNVGIYSLDAGYRVSAGCATSGCVGEIDDVGSGWDPTVFENLYVGIWATNSFTNHTINVDRCLFVDNGYGVELVSVLSPVIIRSKFKFTDDVSHFAVSSAMHGIHAINSKNLKIEENTFIDTAPGAPNAHGVGTFGVVSSDLGEQYERIYKNTFQGVTNACYAQGKNRSVSTNGLVGLEFPCNTNINNHWDHRIVPTLWGIDGSNYGVKKTSGTSIKPVGTTFTNDVGGIYADEDYRSSSHFPITYWYHTSQMPDDWSTSSVTMFTNPLAPANACLSTIISFGSGVMKLPQGDKAAIQSEFYAISNEILLKEAEYENNLLDLGEISFIMAQIDNLAPNNKQSVRDMLITYSPYLTTEILFTVANNAPSDYNHIWLRDLLIANIESVTPELLSFLQTKQFPLPTSMRQSVANAMGVTYTQKTVLESEISQLYADRAFFSNSLLNDVLHDTTFVDTDSLRRWLTLQNNILFQQQIIDSYLQDGNFGAADVEIDNFELFALTLPAHLRIEIADFVSLKRWVISVLQIPGQITQLSVADLAYLRNMANRSSGTARYQAQNILCFFYHECEFYFIDSESGPKSQMTTSYQVLDEPEPTFSIYPNPASNWVMIELSQKTFDQLENTEIIITDITGKIIHQTQLMRNAYLWETGPIQNGVYLIIIKSNDQLFATQKVIVNH